MSEKKSQIAQLEEEGDVAADYLEALLDIADLDGDIAPGKQLSKPTDLSSLASTDELDVLKAFERRRGVRVILRVRRLHRQRSPVGVRYPGPATVVLVCPPLR